MGIAAAIGVGAVASIGGSMISSGAAKSASRDAAAASERSAELSAQVQRENYANNQANLSPFMQTGNAAMGQINALLGIPGASGGTAANPGHTDWQQYISSQPDVTADYKLHQDMTPDEYGAWHYAQDGSRRDLTPYTVGATAAIPAADATAAANSAFQNYQNSTGYQFRVGQGMNAVNSGYAGKGTLQSGAALKAINDYGQGMATAEFGNYLNALGNQQSLGMQGASALAGVGSNYANSMGNIYTANGNNQANSALARGQAGAQVGNTIAGLGGQALGYGMNSLMSGGFGGSSLSPVNYAAMTTPANIMGY